MERHDRTSGASGEGAKISLPSDCDILITRSFSAPRHIVFDAWTKAEHVMQWWDPTGTPLAISEIDLRPGGAFRFVHCTPQGEGHAFTGKYREVQPPACLVFATPAPGGGESVGALLFDEQDGGTFLTLRITSATKEGRDALLRFGVDSGTARTLDNLNRYLEKFR